jgi:hypothetical protein
MKICDAALGKSMRTVIDLESLLPSIRSTETNSVDDIQEVTPNQCAKKAKVDGTLTAMKYFAAASKMMKKKMEVKTDEQQKRAGICRDKEQRKLLKAENCAKELKLQEEQAKSILCQ